MAKRVEKEQMPGLGNISLDSNEQLLEVPKVQEKAPVLEVQETVQRQEASEPINCLRNERVIVRFVESPNAMVRGKGHVLSGCMA